MVLDQVSTINISQAPSEKTCSVKYRRVFYEWNPTIYFPLLDLYPPMHPAPTPSLTSLSTLSHTDRHQNIQLTDPCFPAAAPLHTPDRGPRNQHSGSKPLPVTRSYWARLDRLGNVAGQSHNTRQRSPNNRANGGCGAMSVTVGPMLPLDPLHTSFNPDPL